MIAACLISCKIWDGGYKQSKIDLVFVNERGQPIKDVVLKVFVTRYGKEALDWPVTNYTADSPVRSDSNGIISLFHKRFGHFEFGGWSFLRIFYARYPHQFCRFYYNDKLIYKKRYSKLYEKMLSTLTYDAHGNYSESHYVVSDFTLPTDTMSSPKYLYYKKTITVVMKQKNDQRRSKNTFQN
jgi:hypothetical protein